MTYRGERRSEPRTQDIRKRRMNLLVFFPFPRPFPRATGVASDLIYYAFTTAQNAFKPFVISLKSQKSRGIKF